MDVKTAIESRRSIRKYLDKDVPHDLVDSVIDAARLAPSGNNTQPWRFMIVRDTERLRDIIKDEFVYSAPVVIVCCADPSAYTKRVEGWDDENRERAIRDLAIASGFLVLRATELGLGTCYCGWIQKQKIKDGLGIPSHFIVPYVISLGYAAESPSARPRKSREDILL